MSRTGNTLFRLGFAVLILSVGTLPFWDDFSSKLITAVFIAMVVSAVMIVAGEAIRISGQRQGRAQGDGFMDYYREIKKKSKSESGGKPIYGRSCAFCGMVLQPSHFPADMNGSGEISGADRQAGQCEECGKISCPQCAFKKGMEMGVRSFRCPSCGGRVH